MKSTAKPTSSPKRRDTAGPQGLAAKPLHPYLVMLVAVILPGVGQVLNNTPARGLTMVFFMLLLGMITFHLSTPDQSFAGRYAGGLFIYSISVIDAYQWARHRWEYYRRYGGQKGEDAG